ncbi:MAG TPA: hypothetical protein VL737_00680 [Candidatus Pristimantibacillus sp.]|nr:hypothetical protein [Candidatus Pristimantibacillus sp.]
MSNSRVDEAVRSGTAYLKSAQLPDGRFDSQSSAQAHPFKPAKTYQTVFGPAILLAALSGIDNAEVMVIREKLAAWLLEQRGPEWSFNYWAKSAPERKTLPYPDDLDDTFCSLAALRLHDPALIDEAALGKAVRLLIAAEQQVGGPYQTWLIDKTAGPEWTDTDLVVNCNVARFLNLVAEPLPNLTALMDQAITSRRFRSAYYPDEYPVIFSLAQAYRGQLGDQLAEYILGLRRAGWWGSPQNSALAIAALRQLGNTADLSPALNKLLSKQRADGSWPAEAFCLDPAIGQRSHYSGSAALTTALVLKVLSGTPAALAPVKNQKPGADKSAADLYGHVLNVALQETKGLDPALKRQMATIRRRLEKDYDCREIILLPYYFNTSLMKPLGGKHELLAQLGAANYYGWAAYTIYDDFLDNEGDPRLLSAANTALRYCLQHFRQALPDNGTFQMAVNHTFNTIDDANAREVQHFRFKADGEHISIEHLPHYASRLALANRSLGHTLTPLGVLAARGIGPDDRRAQSVQLAIRHYIVARQLNDDLHDWEQDLRKGLASYVVTAILRDMAQPPGRYRINNLLNQARPIFWRQTVSVLCRDMLEHTALARRAARSSGLLQPDNIIEQLTGKIDRSAHQTLAEQVKSKRFLTAYRAA